MLTPNPKTFELIKSFQNLKIHSVEINCPYWCNKLRDGAVVVRGYENGKGKADDIAKELMRLCSESASKEDILTASKQNRIGIDCSGFVYRIMETIVDSQKLNEMFPGGINRTNADTLTRNKFLTVVSSVKDISSGDLIRMMNGHHVLFVTKNDGSTIQYVHSSGKTKDWGVHQGSVTIVDPNKSLEDQAWDEQTSHGENFGKKYFMQSYNDCVVRYI